MPLTTELRGMENTTLAARKSRLRASPCHSRRSKPSTSPPDRNTTLNMFSEGRDTGWKNRLIWGDKKYVLPSLLPNLPAR